MRTPLDRDLLRNLYLEECKTTWQIAKILKVSQWKVHDNLKRLGWIRNKSESQILCRGKKCRKGRLDNGHGYAEIYMPNHPNARANGYILEHRLIMSEHVGRPLCEGEVVHHINGNTHDNRIENLALMKHGEHSRLRATSISSAELLGALRNLSKRLGKSPSMDDCSLKNGSPVSSKIYVKRFGSWIKAKALARV